MYKNLLQLFFGLWRNILKKLYKNRNEKWARQDFYLRPIYSQSDYELFEMSIS